MNQMEGTETVGVKGENSSVSPRIAALGGWGWVGSVCARAHRGRTPPCAVQSAEECANMTELTFRRVNK